LCLDKPTGNITSSPTTMPTMPMKQCRDVKYKKVCHRRRDCRWKKGMGCFQKVNMPPVPVPLPEMSHCTTNFTDIKECDGRPECMWYGSYCGPSNVDPYEYDCGQGASVEECAMVSTFCDWSDDESGCVNKELRHCDTFGRRKKCTEQHYCSWIHFLDYHKFSCGDKMFIGQ
jgi:hypothetical protein